MLALWFQVEYNQTKRGFARQMAMLSLCTGYWFLCTCMVMYTLSLYLNILLIPSKMVDLYLKSKVCIVFSKPAQLWYVVLTIE